MFLADALGGESACSACSPVPVASSKGSLFTGSLGMLFSSSKADILIQDTTTRNDKGEFIKYITKQSKENRFFTDRSYNYKILVY